MCKIGTLNWKKWRWNGLLILKDDFHIIVWISLLLISCSYSYRNSLTVSERMSYWLNALVHSGNLRFNLNNHSLCKRVDSYIYFTLSSSLFFQFLYFLINIIVCFSFQQIRVLWCNVYIKQFARCPVYNKLFVIFKSFTHSSRAPRSSALTHLPGDSVILRCLCLCIEIMDKRKYWISDKREEKKNWYEIYRLIWS